MPNNNGISGTNNNKTINIRNEGIKFLILTNSVLTDKKDIYPALYDKGASIHYLIDKEGLQTQFANENEQTFTNGRSWFRKSNSLNKTAINLMFVNSGYEAYTQEQKDKFKAFLSDFKQRSELDLKINLLGLGEVATLTKENVPEGHGKIFPRHEAPGKLFFWDELAELGFGLFVPTTPQQKANIRIDENSAKDVILALQENLQKYGYDIEASGIYDATTKKWVTRFNQRYVPNNTEKLDALWTEASQISLDHIQQYIHTKTNAATQVASSPSSLFNKFTALAANTDAVSLKTANLSMK